MTTVDATVQSLFWIVLVSVIAPLVAGLVPRRLVPEVVLLLVLGVVIGPYATGLAGTDAPVELLRELGLAMLFLLAGFEIELRELSGRSGRLALGTWVLCLRWPSASSPSWASPTCSTARSPSRSP